jgi:uncharacterized protein YdaL
MFITSCQVFTIKGRKIVEETNAVYTQSTSIGSVKIFITELQNENYFAAVDLMLKESGELLTATEKYEMIGDLARMRRYIEGKTLKKEIIDTVLGNSIVTLEYGNGSKAVFYTIEKNKLFYITNYKRE